MADLPTLPTTYKVVLKDGRFIMFSELRYARQAKKANKDSKIIQVVDGEEYQEIDSETTGGVS